METRSGNSTTRKYEDDRPTSDKSIPAARAIVSKCLGVPFENTIIAPDKDDRVEATDLYVLAAKKFRIAVRVRGYSGDKRFFDIYPYEFTIRSKRKNGMKTEFEKIMSGWGDGFLYGQTDKEGVEITEWWIIRLDEFRRVIKVGLPLVCEINKPNKDGTTSFNSYDLRSFPSNSIVRNRSIPQVFVTDPEKAIAQCAIAAKQQFEFITGKHPYPYG